MPCALWHVDSSIEGRVAHALTQILSIKIPAFAGMTGSFKNHPNHVILSLMSYSGTFRKGFSMALSQEMMYRINFLVGRIREFIVFASLLFLYSAIPRGIGGYSQSHLLTYTLLSALVSAPIFVYGMHTMGEEIAMGELSNYLLRPIGYFRYWTGRIFATRLLTGLSGLVSLTILTMLFSKQALLETITWSSLEKASLLLIGSLILIQEIDFIGAFLSFWTPRGHGPRWFVTIAVTFLSGSYIPLQLLPTPVQNVLSFTPFPSLVYAPVSAAVNHPTWTELAPTFGIQWMWIGCCALLVVLLWRQGLKRYAAYGN